ncbi:glucose 1-dehydrogenase [Sulfitobacter sp. F26204]|uniref:SDR family NAD(P)-dependent oxidoreductase n=1 Tax=Sulfitobacter sp. F26204 TaxID=2996014 RepID=UPI00225E09C6|nr:glucose 1-dehydrogenase [Sulfitobacter sp. F26204]MCX7560629.1 glucose 1-dehydrogenase [Sulfitobacter sp. F26204]
MTGRLDERTAMITGAASGIAATSARMFAEEGAQVVLADLDHAGAEEVARSIRDKGGAAIALRLDVTKADSWREAFQSALTRFARVDVLMNCAGLLFVAPIEDTSVQEFDRLVAVNLKGVFLGCRAAVEHMKQRDGDLPWASIINVSSTAGMIGTANTTLYTMTKGGVRVLSKSVAVEVAERGLHIRCNSLHPGSTETAMFDQNLAQRGMTREAHKQMSKTRNLIGRIGQAEEIASGALFLASDESRFMTGTELVMDGGYSAR